MSRWIDAEWLKGQINITFWAEIGKIIDNAPSIDIVRCGECKYASNDGTYGCMCEHFNDTSDAYHRMWSDDFCSYGEREGER